MKLKQLQDETVEAQQGAEQSGQADKKDDAICFEIDAEQVDFESWRLRQSVALKNFQTWWPSESLPGNTQRRPRRSASSRNSTIPD